MHTLKAIFLQGHVLYPITGGSLKFTSVYHRILLDQSIPTHQMFYNEAKKNSLFLLVISGSTSGFWQSVETKNYKAN